MAVLPASRHESRPQRFTILRVHGVNGWSSEETLQAADVAQVAGDDLSGFYRRQGSVRAGDPSDRNLGFADSGPVTLEAYSWGAFSSKLPVQAFWLLLIPFSFINLAGWMLRPKLITAPETPSQQNARTLPHPILGRLIRLLGVTLTLEFFLAVVGVMVGVVGEQCGQQKCSKVSISLGWLPPGLSYLHPGLPSQPSHRLVYTVLFSVVVLSSLWWLCWLTRRRYEQWPPPHHTASDQEPASRSRLAHADFWRGDERVLRLSITHTAAVVGLLAWTADACRRVHDSHPGNDWIRVTAVVVIAAAAVTSLSDTAVGLRVVRLNASRKRVWLGRTWVLTPLVAGVATLATACVLLWQSKPRGTAPHFAPGWTDAATGVAIAQGILLVLVGLGLLFTLASSRPGAYALLPPDRTGTGWRPLNLGFAPLGACCLGVGVGGAMTTCAIAVSEIVFVVGGKKPAPTLKLLPSMFPYVYAASFLFIVGLVAAFVGVAAVTLLSTARALSRRAAAEVPAPPSTPAPSRQARHGGPAADAVTKKRSRTIWFGYLEAQAPEIAMNGLIGGAPFAVLATSLTWVHPLRTWLSDGNKAGIAGSVLILVGFALTGVLASEQRSASTRRSVGVLWDVATFWPRVGHPFSPPSYGERTVPELRERIRYLVQAGSEVILTSYSQGTVIGTAALLQLPEDIRSHVSLVTLGCPLRRLYGRGFPAWFGFDQLHDLMALPRRTGERPPWVNVWRSTDYVGGWVMQSQRDVQRSSSTCLDVWIRDPSEFGRPPGDQTFPAVNKHLDYFPDPAVADQMLKVLRQRGYRGP